MYLALFLRFYLFICSTFPKCLPLWKCKYISFVQDFDKDFFMDFKKIICATQPVQQVREWQMFQKFGIHERFCSSFSSQLKLEQGSVSDRQIRQISQCYLNWKKLQTWK